MLDCLTERDSGYEKNFSQIIGIYPKISIDFFQDGILTAYHCQEEYDQLEKLL